VLDLVVALLTGNVVRPEAVRHQKFGAFGMPVVWSYLGHFAISDWLIWLIDWYIPFIHSFVHWIIGSIDRSVGYFRQGVHVFICVCVQNMSKSCEEILLEFFGGVGHGPRNIWLDFGGNLDHRPYPVFLSPDRDPYPGILLKNSWSINWLID